MRRLVAMIALATAIAATATPAIANVITRRDGNDTRGPLDLASVTVSHAKGGHVFRITTVGRFTNKEANAKNGFFEVDLDTNADRRPNYFIVVFHAAGRFRGILFKPNFAVITRNLKAARVSPRSVKVTLPLSKIKQRGSYDFAALSSYFAAPCTDKRPCVDAIPNRYPLIRHDFTAPKVTWGSVPAYSSDVSASLTFPVPFNVRDDIYGSGVKSWTLQRRAVGTSAWVAVKSGTALNPTVQLTGDQDGTTYDLRVVAVDQQKNKSISTMERSSIPYDDRNLLFSYSSSTQNDGVTDAFLGSTSSVPQNGTITFTMPFGASDVCVVGGPTTGPVANAAFSEGGSTLAEDGTTLARDRSCLGVSVPSGTMVTFTVTSAEPFVFDGIILVP